jgi:hypothetical protein
VKTEILTVSSVSDCVGLESIDVEVALLPKREVNVVDSREGAFKGIRLFGRETDCDLLGTIVRGGSERFGVCDVREKVGNAAGKPEGNVKAGKAFRADDREKVPRTS